MLIDPKFDLRYYQGKALPCSGGPAEGFDGCPYLVEWRCAYCHRPMCPQYHMTLDTLRNPTGVCVECAMDAAVVLAQTGKDPSVERLTVEALIILARDPSYLAPRQLTLEQAERFMRDLGNDASVRGQWKSRCKATYRVGSTGDGGEVTVRCAREVGHEMSADKEIVKHQSVSGKVWVDEDARPLILA